MAVVAELDAAWADGNADGWVAHYVPDGEFINILGMRMSGADLIWARIDEILQGVFRGGTRESELWDIRFLGSDVAIADVDIEVTGSGRSRPGGRPTEEGVLRTRMRHVLHRIESRWWIVATQNTAAAPAP